MKRWLAVDPGDRWVGWAMLHQDRTAWRADMGVIDVTHQSGRHRLVHNLMSEEPTYVIVEDFQMRAEGHQKFGKGNTLRLIGALEFAAHERRCNFYLVPPNNPDQLDGSYWGNVFAMWLEHADSSQQWSHAKSAWRAMLVNLVVTFPDAFVALKGGNLLNHRRFGEPTTGRYYATDLSAPTLSWTLP